MGIIPNKNRSYYRRKRAVIPHKERVLLATSREEQVLNYLRLYGPTRQTDLPSLIKGLTQRQVSIALIDLGSRGLVVREHIGRTYQVRCTEEEKKG